jgi:hypothetical protein
MSFANKMLGQESFEQRAKIIATIIEVNTKRRESSLENRS